MTRKTTALAAGAGGADAQLSLEEAFAFIEECDTDIFSDAGPAPVGSSPAQQTAGVLALLGPSSELAAAVSSFATAPAPTRAKKKRVRRQKMELEYLRTQVVELEDKLAQLKRVTGVTSIHSSPIAVTSSEEEDDEDECRDDSMAAASPVSAATTCEGASPDRKSRERDSEDADLPSSVTTLWMGVAERQYRERLRAEHQNQRLKSMLEAQIKLAGSLEKLLTKRPSQEVIESVSTTKRVKRHWELTSENDVAIFEQQLADVARAHLDVDKVFVAPEFRMMGATFHDTRVKNDPESDSGGVGLLYEFVSSGTLPFNVRTAGNAFWRMMAFESIKKHTYYQRDVEVTDNLVARTYGLDINTDKFQARFCGKQTVRKYVEADRIVIVWRQLTEPSKVNGTKFHGIQCHETGENDDPAPLTVIQAYAKLVPHLQDDIVDQELQIGALTDFVMGFHELSAALSCQLMADLLVEEDWKTAQQFECMAL